MPRLYRLEYVPSDSQPYAEQYASLLAARRDLDTFKANLKGFSPSVIRRTVIASTARLTLSDYRGFLRARSQRIHISRTVHGVTLVGEGRGLQSAYAHLKEQIQSRRASMQWRSRTRQPHSHWYLIGGVHMKAGEVMSRAKSIKEDRVYQDKTPKTPNRHVGIEIEFCASASQGAVCDAIIEHGLERYVTLKDDGSVHPDRECTGGCRFDGCECCTCETIAQRDNCECDCGCDCTCSSDEGHELCVIAPESEYSAIVKRVCAMLGELSAYVNRSCGLHVHLDVRSRKRERVFRNLYNAQELLFSLVPNTRRTNTFCRRLEHGELSGIALSAERRGDRYLAINPYSLNKRETIEVRLHTGSVSASKINHWVSLLIKLANAKDIAPGTNTLSKAAKYIRIGTRLKTYLASRIKKFSNPYAQVDAA